MFTPIDGWTLILKNGGKWSFSYKTKTLILLSQWGECIWSAQSLKERRLLWICVYPNWKVNSNSKNCSKINFSYEAKASIPLSQWGNEFVVPNHQKKGDYYVNPCLSWLKDEL